MPNALDEDQKRKLLKFFVPSIRNHPDWPVIISEGDSWFSFPIHLNIVDFLDRMAKRRISLLRLEKNGDRALRIIGGKQKLKLADYLGRYPVDALLFSGGGNDVVGRDLLPLLNRREEGMDWEACINKTTAGARFERLRSAYLDLIHLRNQIRPECRIYLHGYDYAIPSGKGARLWGIKVGPWIRPNLERMKIEDPADQKKIVRWLIDRFNEMIADVAAAENTVFIRTRQTLGEAEWNDELHPTRKGFEKVAEKFRVQLAKQFPETF